MIISLYEQYRKSRLHAYNYCYLGLHFDKKKNKNEKPQILVVDDEEIIAEMAADMLQSIGFIVLTASNGIEALELYKEKRS